MTKVDENAYFKGIVTHPNSVSVGPGTFKQILNGWQLRDGVIDMRPGFDVSSATPRAPGFTNITTPGTFAGIRTLGTNTFIQNDGRMFAYELNGAAGCSAISAGDTLDAYNVVSVASNGTYVAFGKSLDSASLRAEPFIFIVNLATGELYATVSDNVASNPYCGGLAFYTDLSLNHWLFYSRTDLNKVFKVQLAAGPLTPTLVVGDGTAGLTDGTPLTAQQIKAPRGLCFTRLSNEAILLIVGDHYLYSADLDTDTGVTIAGSTSSGFVNDVSGVNVRFHTPSGVGVFQYTSASTIYVADTANNVIRQTLYATGETTTWAGSTIGTAGSTNGVGTAARFNAPVGITCVPVTSTDSENRYAGLSEDTMFVADSTNKAIRNIKVSTANVGTIAGNGSAGYVDGNLTNARFTKPMGVSYVIDALYEASPDTPGQPTHSTQIAKIFVADQSESRIRLLDAQNPIVSRNGNNNLVVSTFAGTGSGTIGSQYYQKNNKSGFAGGVYNYNTTTPDTTVAAGQKYNTVMSLFEFSGTTYFNSERGVMAMDLDPAAYSTSQIGRYAGAPQAYDLTLSLVPADPGDGTLLAADYAAAYRLVWGYYTASGRPVLGAPSSRFVITNPSGAAHVKNVQVNSIIPAGVTSSWFYQIYRTTVVNTVGGTITPDDTMYLVYQANPNSTDFGNAYVQITDATPDTFLGQALYTNATEETLSQANTQPPQALDMCLFGGQDPMAVYANTTSKGRMFVNLVGVSGFTGSPTITFTFADGVDTFTITGDSTTENAPAGQFKYSTGGTAATNITNTALSIVKTINQYATNRRIRAGYISDWNGTPGQIVIEEVFINGAQWAIICTSGISANFAPVIPSSGTSYSSITEVLPNGLYISKLQNPDAVPLVNRLTVGDSSESIRRVLPLRESVMVIKERSIWRLVGQTPESMTVTLLDNTVSLRADQSCYVLNNEVYALTTQGVVAISDNGVRIVSRPVEYQIGQIYGTLPAAMDLNGVCVGFGSEQYRTYFLSTFNTTDNFTWAYNVFSDTWTRFDLILQALTINNGRLIGAVVSPTGSNTFEQNTPWIIHQLNQKLYENPLAYYDAGGTCTLTAVNTTTKVISFTYDNVIGKWQYPLLTPTVGWIVGQGLITADDGAGNYTVTDTTGLAVNGTPTLYRPINFFLQSNSHGAGATFKMKQWSDAHVILENQNLYKFILGFATQAQSTTDSYVNITKTVSQNNSTPTSASYYKEQVFNVSVPRAMAVGNLTDWQLQVYQAKVLVGVKAVGIDTRGTESTKVQQ